MSFKDLSLRDVLAALIPLQLTHTYTTNTDGQSLKFTAAHHHTRCAETRCQAADTSQDKQYQQARPSIFTNTHACQCGQQLRRSELDTPIWHVCVSRPLHLPSPPLASALTKVKPASSCPTHTPTIALRCAVDQDKTELKRPPTSATPFALSCSRARTTVVRPIAQQHGTHQRQRVIIFQRHCAVRLLARWQVYQS